MDPSNLFHIHLDFVPGRAECSETIVSRFLESEKQAQIEFKRTSPHLSIGARAEGKYGKHLYPFCLPAGCAEENLLPEIRATAIAHFAQYEIKWHRAIKGQDKPTNHLCDSQVCCVNFLFPFADKPDALANLLRPIYPNIRRMLPIENDLYITFEWIGEENYLRELIHQGSKRIRGALYTSADAIVRFECADGTRQTVLIEWKYAESYYPTPRHKSRSGTDRTAIYRPLFLQPDCPIDKELLPEYEALFYEPFDQLMRQQLLAREMEKAREMDADRVTVLHIAPAANIYFRRVTSPQLTALGPTAVTVWSTLIPAPGRFLSVNTEDLFRPLLTADRPDLARWRAYVGSRYRWVNGIAAVA